MPPSDKQILAELRDNQITLARKQDNLENGMSILNSKLDKLIQFLIPVVDSGGSEDHNAESLVQYFENHYGHLREMGRSYLKDECYKVRKTKLRMWRNLLNKRKIAFYNAIKSKGMADTYEGFYEREEKYIPKKFREHITTQDTEPQKRIKHDLSIAKFRAQIDILHDKKEHYTTMYLEIDEELQSEIMNLCPQETHDFLEDLWIKETKYEEEKSKKIWDKKEQWIRTLPEQEKEERKKREREIQKKKQVKQQQQRQTDRRNLSNESSQSASYSDERTYTNENQGQRITKGHNTSRLMRRNETFVNRSYADIARPQAYDDHFPDAGVSRGNSQGQGVQRNTRNIDSQRNSVNADETLYIGQNFRKRRLKYARDVNDTYSQRNHSFLDDETNLKLPP